LKSPLAAEIKEPGRAYLQVGNNEIFELFQSAYSGDSEKAIDNFVKPFKISQVAASGKRSVVFEQKKASNDEKGRTQLEAIVDYVGSYCEKSGINRLPNICLPSLGKTISFVPDYLDCADKKIDIGIYDDPDNQYQGSTMIDIDTKNTFIIGSAQYGKTNLLQLIIREIAMKNSPEEANIYILDFASMVLKNFEGLNHVGGVVCSSDDEKYKNLIKLLMEEISSRKEKIVSIGVSSFSAYCEAGYTDMPHIYVIVDNMTALMELYLQEDDSFLILLREGISVGITFIVSNGTTSGMSYRYLSNFANKISLYCNDSGEYSNLFDRPKLQPDNIPGRVIVELDKRILESQTYVAFTGEKEVERSKAIHEFVLEYNDKYGSLKARNIPYIPAVLNKDVLASGFNAVQEKYNLPIGLDYEDVKPKYLDFSSLGAIGVCGKEGTGHYNFVSYLLNTLNNNRMDYPVEAVIIDDIKRRYRSFEALEIVDTYTTDCETVKTVINNWYSVLLNRYDAMIRDQEKDDAPLLLMILNNNDAANEISSDMDLMDKYKEMLTRLRALRVCIIFSNYPNQEISYDAPDPLRMIKQERHMIYFGNLGDFKVFDFPYDEIRRNKKKHQKGDAFYVDDSLTQKLKIVKA
jgi:S-DNA-T family DNA segregation ATPase FtsK/SpoIIIE